MSCLLLKYLRGLKNLRLFKGIWSQCAVVTGDTQDAEARQAYKTSEKQTQIFVLVFQKFLKDLG